MRIFMVSLFISFDDLHKKHAFSQATLSSRFLDYWNRLLPKKSKLLHSQQIIFYILTDEYFASVVLAIG